MSGGVYTLVQTGPYSGFTREEMRTEWERYKDALKTSGSNLASVSLNQQAFSLAARRDWSLAEWGKQVRNALAQVDPSFAFTPSSGQIRTRFRDC